MELKLLVSKLGKMRRIEGQGIGVPDFDNILATLRQAEKTINGSEQT